jgi:DNA-binding beta-propeller fold protein YncE
VIVPVIFTTGFNPTNATVHTNALGRELVLVTVTGAIGAGVGTSNVLTEGAVDVIDAATRTLVATIPLGLAGPSFGEIAIDPAGQVGLLGATSERSLYAVDLRALDDPALFSASGGPPVVLDGSTPGFPDARIFTAEAPFVIPHRADGPDLEDCAGLTHVDVNTLGTQAFATDFCDGTLSVVGLDLVSLPPIPAPASRFALNRVEPTFAPNVPESLTQLRTPGIVRVRPGLPGVDYTGPDVFVVVGQPDGAVCGIRIESP